VEQLAIGQGGQQIFDGLQRGAIFQAVPGEEGLGGVDVIMGGGPEGEKAKRGADTTYYATNPRTVGALGEKSSAMAFTMQSAGKTGHFWGNVFRSRVGTLEL
jgi:hypothetical protein